jgi:hypothetical protein
MILHTLNYTTLDTSSQPLNLDNFKIIGKFKVVGNSSNISGHPSEGFSIPFLFENYDFFQIIHYPERYYFRIKDNANNWLAWQRHKHKIDDIDGLQSILDSFNSRISALENIRIGLPPGVILAVAWNSSFYTGLNVLPLNGDGILISSYPELVNATYVGDSFNNDNRVHFFYKYNPSPNDPNIDIRNTNGSYFRLPDTRALVPKGRRDLGTGVTYFNGRVKTNSDFMGNLQEDALEDHKHWRFPNNQIEETLLLGNSHFEYYFHAGSDSHTPQVVVITGSIYQGRTSTHTRDSSFAVDFVITY